MSLHAYILAGGKSSRMGEEKGMMLFREKPLIQYVIENISEVVETIFIVTSNTVYTQFQLPLIEDHLKELGPAGGIDTVLQHSTATHNLVVACDMPFIDRNSLQYLINESKQHEITVPVLNQYPEALLAVYSTSCYQRWHDGIEEGTLKLSDLLTMFATKFVDGNMMQFHNPLLFKNMNSRQDLEDFAI